MKRINPQRSNGQPVPSAVSGSSDQFNFILHPRRKGLASLIGLALVCIGSGSAMAAINTLGPNLVVNGNFPQMSTAPWTSFNGWNSEALSALVWYPPALKNLSTDTTLTAITPSRFACLLDDSKLTNSTEVRLEANTRYRLSFNAVRTQLSGPNDRARVPLTVGIKDAATYSPRYYEGDFYFQQMVPVGIAEPDDAYEQKWTDRILNSRKYNALKELEFTTPVTVTGSLSAILQLGVSTNSPIGLQYPNPAKVCVTDIALQKVTPAPAAGADNAGYAIFASPYQGPNIPSVITIRVRAPVSPATAISPGIYSLVFADSLTDKVITGSTGRGVTLQVDSTKFVKDVLSGDYVQKVVLDTKETDPDKAPWKFKQGVTVRLQGTGQGGGYIYTRSNPIDTLDGGFKYAKLAQDALSFFAQQASTDQIIPEMEQNSAFEANPLVRRGFVMTGQGVEHEYAKCFAGNDLFGNQYTGCPGTPMANGIDVQGGWFDAADHGKYVVNGAVSLWHLQNMIERVQKQRGMGYLQGDAKIDSPKKALDIAFPDGDLRLGTWGGYTGSAPYQDGFSDLLYQAYYQMAFLMRMQIPVKKVSGVQAAINMKVPVGNQDISANYTLTQNVNNTVAGTAASLPVAKLKLTMSDADVTGMVFSAVHDAKWTPIPTLPQDDMEQRVLDYPTTIATLDFAAVAAQCYRIFSVMEGFTNFANECLAAADLAWTAANKNKQIFRYGEYANGYKTTAFPNGVQLPAITDGGGAYADTKAQDEFYWAGMELYLARKLANRNVGDALTVATASAKAECGNEHPNLTLSCRNWIATYKWDTVYQLGVMSAVTAGEPGIRLLALESLKTSANELLNRINTNPYGIPVGKNSQEIGWGSNSTMVNAAAILGTAFDADVPLASTGKKGYQKYINGVAAVMGYVLGNNPLGRSYVTGHGPYAPTNVHHRFWAKHHDAISPAPPSGLLVGGPNGQIIAADIAAIHESNGALATPGGVNDKEFSNLFLTQTLNVPGCLDAANRKLFSPMKCYQDDYRVFQINEVAVNWNAPLFWGAQFLSQVSNWYPAYGEHFE
ncbi:MAG: glycoside hydrolase family 9 protein [Pseudomonadota bacterium]